MPLGVVTQPSESLQPSSSPGRFIGSRTSLANLPASSSTLTASSVFTSSWPGSSAMRRSKSKTFPSRKATSSTGAAYAAIVLSSGASGGEVMPVVEGPAGGRWVADGRGVALAVKEALDPGRGARRVGQDEEVSAVDDLQAGVGQPVGDHAAIDGRHDRVV